MIGSLYFWGYHRNDERFAGFARWCSDVERSLYLAKVGKPSFCWKKEPHPGDINHIPKLTFSVFSLFKLVFVFHFNETSLVLSFNHSFTKLHPPGQPLPHIYVTRKDNDNSTDKNNDRKSINHTALTYRFNNGLEHDFRPSPNPRTPRPPIPLPLLPILLRTVASSIQHWGYSRSQISAMV